MAEIPDQQLIIRFRGICGHIDLPDRKNKKRTVLVRHQHNNGNGNGHTESHIPYIEFFADDVESTSEDLIVTQFSRPGIDGRFARITVDDPAEISFKDILPGEVQEDPSYHQTVLHIKDILRQEITVVESLRVNDAGAIKNEHVAAVFDMPKGHLLGGEPEPMLTRFDPEVRFKARRLARWSDLYITYKPPLVLKLVALGDKEEHEITFKDSLRMLTIGNEPERLAFGTGTFGVASIHADDHSHNGASNSDGTATLQQTLDHYSLYYSLIENPPNLRPVPVPTLFDGSGCPNSNFP